ncbi:SDR family oxidoreductase [soil metagenome]
MNPPLPRRDFLRTSALLGGAAALGVPLGASAADPEAGAGMRVSAGAENDPPARRSLRILILGGTGFTGPHQVRYAVERGHQVTVFNRGRRQADLGAGVEELVGDRNTGELDALRGRSWDAVIDNPTTLPFWVRDAGEVLRDATGQYVFISTLSAYDVRGAEAVDEDTPLMDYADGDPLDVTPEAYQERGGALYGPMKAASEREAARWFGERTTVIRPGLIVGPGDQTDRFTYWPVRIARGGEVLAPGTGRDRVQVIDARDLAEWTVRVVEEGATGNFNAVGPRAPLTMAEQLHGIRGALSGDLEVGFTWVPADFLQSQGVRPWSEMTTWFGPDAVLSKASNARAVAAGLTYRPLATTTQDTLDWFRSLPAERQAAMQAGLEPEKERAVLAAWREHAPAREPAATDGSGDEILEGAGSR